ncbi:hypothetical protein U14_02418 [Candidatus Moduliflexus flocculans]|uniref:Cobalt transport protein n=1 Tax=Candidatus Moduliflexus flocculans TaxID=1499966 RepID=A0A081BLB0_9BACT|nr:hypothetical protein U14_02418 [Candidatus Moduliflexus flocculans]
MFKFIFAAIALVAMIVGLGYIYLDVWQAQVAYFAAILIVMALRKSFRQALAELRLFLPFVVMMLAIYAVFGLLNVKHDQPQQSALAFWLLYGVNRVLCFLNTALSLSLLLSWFQVNDVLALPIPIRYTKALILGRSLFTKARGALDEIDLHLRHFPDQRFLPARWHLRLFAAFQRQLLLVLTLIFYILEEAEIQGELIDNRITHCMIK